MLLPPRRWALYAGKPLVSPAESAQIDALTMRLFGTDGQSGGAIGVINMNIAEINRSIETLINDRKVAEAFTAERRELNHRRETIRLALASVIGGGIVSIAVALILSVMHATGILV